MQILALDQARNGAWSIFDYDTGELTAYSAFEYDLNQYTYAQAIMHIEALVDSLIKEYDISAVFMEDIQLRVNVKAFKKLAQLQGVLINYCEKHNILYGVVAPSQWQNYCCARGRSSKEVKANVVALDTNDRKESKILSMQFVKDKFGINTDNDNIADAICIGYYVCETIKIKFANARRSKCTQQDVK